MIELRPDETPARKSKTGVKETMDEIVATNASVHFEMKSASELWGSIESDGLELRIWIRAVRGRIVFTAEFEDEGVAGCQ